MIIKLQLELEEQEGLVQQVVNGLVQLIIEMIQVLQDQMLKLLLQ